MSLHIIIDNKPNIEAHAIEIVKKLLAAVDTGAPLITARDDAHEPFECDECGKTSWRKINSYKRTCDPCEAEEDAKYAAREALEDTLTAARIEALKGATVTHEVVAMSD